MIPAWILWSSVGMLAREVLPDSMFPKFAAKTPPPAQVRAGARVQGQAGGRAAPRGPAVGSMPARAGEEWDARSVETSRAPDSPPEEYVPMDPSLPMDPWIDSETEQGVLAALEWEDDRQLDGFAQSISHEGDPFGYGYYPIAAGYLRYRAKIIREARESLARFEAEQAQKERIARGIATAPKTDTVGTAAPATQAPPPSLQAVPAVRVKIKKGSKSFEPNGAALASVPNTAPTESPPSLEGAE
jgi:hypothetical protein